MWLALWRLEWRGIARDRWALVELAGFLVCCLLIFRLALPEGATPVPIPMVVWITMLFGGVLFLAHGFDREWASDGSRILEGWRQIPGLIPRLFWVKWLSTSVILLATAGLAVLLLWLQSPAAATPAPLWLWAPLGIGILGMTALGTLFAAGVVMEPRRAYLLPLLIYPLAIPLILAVAQCMATGMATQLVATIWLKLAMGCALLYVTLASWLFPHLIEE